MATVYAILDETTRVLKRSTTRDPPIVVAGEVAVVMDPRTVLDGSPVKFDVDGKAAVATQAEFEAAHTPKPTETQAALIAAWDAVAKDDAVPESMKALAALEIARHTPKFTLA